jgi:hypothetical protein
MERFGAFQNRPEKGIIQILSADMAVDERSFEAIRAASAFELISGSLRTG